MHKVILFCCTLLILIPGRGQVSMSVQPPPGGMVQKNQLWNIILVNGGNEPLNLTIGLSLYDTRGGLQDNQLLFTALSKTILVPKGVKQVQVADVSPIEYNYTSPDADITRLLQAFLPVGNFRACYSVYLAQKGVSTILTEDCMNFDVDPLAPPQLVVPSDSGNIETPYPQFNWLPPSPVNLFRDLNYDLLVTEVYSGQTAYDAIQQNIPVYFGRHLTNLADNFPASYKGLDTAKLYAWRVVAKNGDAFACQSEVWTFKLNTKNPETATRTSPGYLELRRADMIMNSAIISRDTIGVSYYSYSKTHQATVYIKNINGQVVSQFIREIAYGNNLLEFKLTGSIAEDRVYRIELVEPGENIYTASFRKVSH